MAYSNCYGFSVMVMIYPPFFKILQDFFLANPPGRSGRGQQGLMVGWRTSTPTTMGRREQQQQQQEQQGTQE